MSREKVISFLATQAAYTNSAHKWAKDHLNLSQGVTFANDFQLTLDYIKDLEAKLEETHLTASRLVSENAELLKRNQGQKEIHRREQMKVLKEHKKSALMRKSKEELADLIIMLEHNYNGLNERFDNQYNNIIKMLNDMSLVNKTYFEAKEIIKKCTGEQK